MTKTCLRHKHCVWPQKEENLQTKVIGRHSLYNRKIGYIYYFNVLSSHFSQESAILSQITLSDCGNNKVLLRYKKTPLSCIVFGSSAIQTHHILMLIKCVKGTAWLREHESQYEKEKRELKIWETVLRLKWKKTTGNIYELWKQKTSQQFI